jgi:hypothetical protein
MGTGCRAHCSLLYLSARLSGLNSGLTKTGSYGLKVFNIDQGIRFFANRLLVLINS